ncbi:MAG: hypothetical protein LAN71_02070 [Acidobacteriia bacterium]|nr:hypothetical protein [Terriglobia bacterium]
MFNSRRYTFAAFLVLALAAVLLPRPANAEPDPSSKHKKSGGGPIPFAVGVKVSSLGLGVEAGIGLGSRLNIRAGLNGMNYTHRIASNGIQYDATLRFRSAEALVDIFLFKSFHVSPGLLLYNGNKITANAFVPGGSTFTLNGVPLVSDPANPVNGTGAILLNKAAPMIRWGFGNMVPRKSHFSFHIEGGIIFQGTPKAQLALNGSACDPIVVLLCYNVATDPTIQSQVQAQQTKINNDLKIIKFYPAFSMGLSYRF